MANLTTKIFMGLAAASLCHTGAFAETSEFDTQTAEGLRSYLAHIGDWDFKARRKGPDGKPECTELWTFNADGTGEVISGEQKVTLTWRTEIDEHKDRWIRRTSQSSTAGRDCLGKVSDPASYPRKEGGFTILFNVGLRYALICSPATRGTLPDGTPTSYLSDAHCWGVITPVISEQTSDDSLDTSAPR